MTEKIKKFLIVYLAIPFMLIIDICFYFYRLYNTASDLYNKKFGEKVNDRTI